MILILYAFLTIKLKRQHVLFIPYTICVHEISDPLDDATLLYFEAFEHMLEGWVSILHESHAFPSGFCKQSGGVEVFDTYIQCNLAAPDGKQYA